MHLILKNSLPGKKLKLTCRLPVLDWLVPLTFTQLSNFWRTQKLSMRSTTVRMLSEASFTFVMMVTVYTYLLLLVFDGAMVIWLKAVLCLMVLTDFLKNYVMWATYFILWIILHNWHFFLTAEIIHLMIVYPHLMLDIG